MQAMPGIGRHRNGNPVTSLPANNDKRTADAIDGLVGTSTSSPHFQSGFLSFKKARSPGKCSRAISAMLVSSENLSASPPKADPAGSDHRETDHGTQQTYSRSST